MYQKKVFQCIGTSVFGSTTNQIYPVKLGEPKVKTDSNRLGFTNLRLQGIICLVCCILFFVSCRKEIPPKRIDLNSITGFYLLNEGVMGTNKASIDYYDYKEEIYLRNIFPSVNPDVVFELGDVGNDLKIYGSRLYAVINNSGLIEVMDKKTAKHIGQFAIPNCRSIAFYGNKAYVSSYAGAVYGTSQIGFVAEIDTATLQETRRVNVGYQPEEMEVIGDKLYVANSGGYNIPSYDNTVSIIDLQSFKEIKKLAVAINLFHLKKDNSGNIFVSSRGNYDDVPSSIFKINIQTETVENLNITCDNFCISGDSLFVVSVEYNPDYSLKGKNYIIYNIKNKNIITNNFITDGTDASITTPYDIDFNPQRKEIYVTDVKTYTVSGEILCFSVDGKKKWSKVTGYVPSKIAFLIENN